MMQSLIQYIGYLVLLVALAVPLGIYMEKVMNARQMMLNRFFGPLEIRFYQLLGIQHTQEMPARVYLTCVLLTNLAGFLLIFLLLLVQNHLPLNPEGWPDMSLPLAFNTAASFVTNTNWQSYQGEAQLSYLTQMLGMTTQNFVSAGSGIAVLFALLRGFVRTKATTIGNFWVDLTRSIAYILLPLAVAVTMVLASQGVVQNFSAYEAASLSEPVQLADGAVIQRMVIPQGPAASQVAIKQIGTNGGGFFGANSAHPMENPTPLSNLVELLSILLLPMALCVSFGRAVYAASQGRTLFLTMFLLLSLGLGIIGLSEQAGTSALAQQGVVVMQAADDQSGGNMEGKETRFGIASSAAWAEFTTAASNGSVNSMHDSYTPLSLLVMMVNMQLGEIIFGGVGCGLYGMLCFAILTVFIAGLMVGRTPEYLGKKIEPYEMKMAVLVCLVPPVAILAGSGIAALLPGTPASLGASGAHGFSELLYAFTSCGANNGSAMAGFAADTPFFNILLGVIMLFTRFVPMAAILAIAGSLAAKRQVAVTEGTLRTDNLLFAGLLLGVILLVGALSFFPALALGPIAEYLQAI